MKDADRGWPIEAKEKEPPALLTPLHLYKRTIHEGGDRHCPSVRPRSQVESPRDTVGTNTSRVITLIRSHEMLYYNTRPTLPAPARVARSRPSCPRPPSSRPARACPCLPGADYRARACPAPARRARIVLPPPRGVPRNGRRQTPPRLGVLRSELRALRVCPHVHR